MDAAVALVQAYLRVNGYLTVAEYPVMEAVRAGGYRAATDLDILAFRFPRAGRRLAGGEPEGPRFEFAPDPALGCPPDRADMLVGEVKEGKARLNPAMRDPEVLGVALARFGCCPLKDAARAAEELLRRGRVVTSAGHRARIVAFGSGSAASARHAHTVVDLGHVIGFLRGYFREHWDVLRHAQFKDEVLALTMLFEKATGGRGAVGDPGARDGRSSGA